MRKNLLDVEEDIRQLVKYINNNEETIIGVEISEITLLYLNNNGIYKFSDVFNNDIPIVINNTLENSIVVHREKITKATEYIPYDYKDRRDKR